MLSVLPTPLDGLDESWMAFFPPGGGNVGIIFIFCTGEFEA